MATRIVLIEDETPIRDNVTTLLSLKGYDVESAPNGREGISLAMVSQPDLILCDIMMPEMDGYQVLEAIRSNRSLATVPFIFLTAKTEDADVRRGMISGADDYLTKPFTLESLLLAIESRLQREALRESDLQSRLGELRRTITRMSNHEYNTPLSGILGFVTLLMEHYNEFDQEDSLSMLGMIKTCGLRLKRSLDNLRLMEDLQENPASVQFIKGISRLDSDVVNHQIRTVNERHDQPIQSQIDVAGAPVCMSETGLRIVLDELIDNAHKFSNGSSPIRITGRRAGDSYRLTIVNRGQPFKPEDIARIAPYVQFDRKSYEQQGSGLGLAIVKKLLEVTGNTLEIESLPMGETSVTAVFQGVNNG
ncbi:hybrid sensor histidine kinase/response regulator [Larkinella sp.]|uniref:hybrid sensor histidine kinase/response regulator n=1 Tax=Larkinella sp. TaxID=2034517 RepID=UPI003BA8C5EC